MARSSNSILLHTLTVRNTLPEVFPNPYRYETHPVAMEAAEHLMPAIENSSYIEKSIERSGVGKMFGVLVVKDNHGNQGYLAAFSGKIGDRNDLEGFVPPVYDTLDPEGFYKKGEERLNQLNLRITALEQSPDLILAEAKYQSSREDAEAELHAAKTTYKQGKAHRKQLRAELADMKDLSPAELIARKEELNRRSQIQHFRLKDAKAKHTKRIAELDEGLKNARAALEEHKEERKALSQSLQKRLHKAYSFLNVHQESQSLPELFKESYAGIPPAGAGECCAPKLFQYAFTHDLQPICMTEFWWGPSPSSEIRKHGHFYPPCRGKCRPILKHMLQGMHVAPLHHLDEIVDVELDILYEDSYIVAIHKPSGVLSVPGKDIKLCIQSALNKRYAESETSPTLVHRLDMATSGVLLAAKYHEAYVKLQRLFIKRKIEKRYVAVLDGAVNLDEGLIDLPLRVDLDDRPRQLVDHKLGKSAQTKYKVIARDNGSTRVHFYPITGRTHQLRVHAAHPAGLDTPIVGDSLYGQPYTRLHLHAESIQFNHPFTGELITIIAPCPF